MALNIFLDSSFLISLLIKREVTHYQARKIIREYSGSTIHINQLIIFESINVTRRKWGVVKAKKLYHWLQKHLQQGDIKLINIDSSLWGKAIEQYLTDHSKKGPNVFDHLHFTCMSEYGLKDVLTFDRHFQKFGFNILG